MSASMKKAAGKGQDYITVVVSDLDAGTLEFIAEPALTGQP